MNFFDIVFAQPVVNLFYGIYLIGRDVGVATVFMALIIRLIMYPYIKKSYITGQKTRLVQPLIKKIQKEYKGDLSGQQAALKKLYSKYDIKISLAGLIVLLQLPIYFALFNLIQQVNNNSPITGLYPFLFGSITPSLETQAFGLIDITETGTPTTIIMAVLTLIFTFLTAKYFIPSFTTKKKTTQANPETKSTSDTAEKKPDQLIDTEVFNSIFQAQITYLMPVVSFIINLQFAAGLNLYFLAGTVFGLVQQARLHQKYRLDKDPIEEDEELFSDLSSDLSSSKKTSEETKSTTSNPQIPQIEKPSKAKKSKKSSKTKAKKPSN